MPTKPKNRKRRWVNLCRGVPKARKGGRQPQLWAFGIASLADAFGQAEAVIRRAVRAGTLDPTRLESILAYVPKRPGRPKKD